MKVKQLQAIAAMYAASQTENLSENESRTQDINQTSTTKTETEGNAMDGKTFNPVATAAPSSIFGAQQSKAASGSAVSWNNIANGDLSNSNTNTDTSETMQNDLTASVSRTHSNQYVEQYYAFKAEANNILQPVLSAVDLLFIKVYQLEEESEP